MGDLQNDMDAKRLVEAERLFRLALRFERLNTKRSIERAVRLYGQAAHLGHPEAMYRYFICYSWGIGLHRNERRAYSWCQKSAGSGYAVALGNIAFYYETGENPMGIVDRGLAECCYRKASELGDPYAMCKFGMILVKRGEVEDGISLICQSAELDCWFGLLNLDTTLVCGSAFLERDVARGMEMLFRGRDALFKELSESNRLATHFFSIRAWADCVSGIGQLVLELSSVGDFISISDASCGVSL
uniref:Sel1 domain containing protein n=1 Tax=Coptotermes formosanus TaxID=36987 RepID=R4V3T5_COPFO|nr:Sel1 domain containing protein [Coptotermes formosanus]